MAKLNFDASINTQRDCYGLGVIARDADGTVCLTTSKTQWPHVTAEMAECRAAEWVVQLAKRQQWKDVIIEGDASVVIAALKKD